MYSLRRIWGFILLVLLLVTGCTTAEISQPAPMQPCTPDAEEANPYNQPTEGMANTIHSFSLSAVPGDTSTKRIAQHEAFLLLVDEVRAWSDYVDLPMDGNLIIRITITFISPKLVESAILNQILYTGIPVADFAKSVADGQNRIAQRDELVFLVTITASKYTDRLLPNDSLLIQIPVNNMVLMNSEGLSVGPRHRDGHLVNQINLHSEPEHGYLAYPIAVEADQVCQWLVDPLWNTTLSLHVQNLYVNDSDYGPQTWSMDYHPLVEIDSPPSVPAFLPPPTGEDAKYTPAIEAPLVENGKPRSDAEYWNGYWENMSRFIWYHLTDTTHH